MRVANAPSFATMFVHKIFVAVLFEFRIMRSARIPESVVKVIDILFKKIIRREITSAAEPSVIFNFEIPEVGMNRRDHGIQRM